MRHSGSVFASVLWLAGVNDLSAQRPDTGRPEGLSRLTLEATLLGGAPAATALECNGRVVRIRELDPERRVEGGPRAALEAFVATLLRDELDRRHAWLDDDAYDAAYAEFAEPYDSTPFTVAVIATKFRGYPSLEVFQQRWRLRESFARTLPETAFDDAALAAEAERSRALLTDATVDVEWWFHPAPVAADGRGDFAAATAVAERTLARLRAGEASTDAKAQQSGVEASFAHGETLSFNQLRQRLRESEFTTLLREGIADAVFAAKPGEWIGPLRGSDGVYVVRALKRSEPQLRVDLTLEHTQKLVRELVLQRRFAEWIDDVYARAVVRVVPPPTGR